jgi:hypothetical protein
MHYENGYSRGWKAAIKVLPPCNRFNVEDTASGIRELYSGANPEDKLPNQVHWGPLPTFRYDTHNHTIAVAKPNSKGRATTSCNVQSKQ